MNHFQSMPASLQVDVENGSDSSRIISESVLIFGQ
jgi:hypothetical protein